LNTGSLMAYLVLMTQDGRETGRQQLDQSISIGRSRDCDLCLHDIRLSRIHCRVEHVGEKYILVDLESRNGTLLNGLRISRKTLKAGDRIIAGTTHILFQEGPLKFFENRIKAGLLDRPADPFEAMSATVAGMEFTPKFGAPIERVIVRPTPRPIPINDKVCQEERMGISSSPALDTHTAAQSVRLRASLETGSSNTLLDLSRALPMVHSRWQRRVLWMMVQIILSAGLIGAGLLAMGYSASR
jgi:pSer/pThr/pTyr-binding forkhead associated (FHA) protein